MDCTEVVFSGHAIRRMFERAISKDDVLITIKLGEIIESYPNDTPYPSVLLLGFMENFPLHVVLAKDELTGSCIIITVYIPGTNIWEPGYKRRKKR